MPRFTPAPQPADRSLLQVALLVSLACHILLLFLQSPFPALLTRSDWTPLALEVVLNQAPEQTSDTPVKTLSQHDSKAGTVIAKNSAANLAADPQPAATAARTAPPATPRADKPDVAKQAGSEYRLPEALTGPPLATEPPAQRADWLTQARQIAGEQTRSEQDPKGKAIYGISATGVSWARYVEDWRLKVERIGKLNYPAEASSRNLFGTLELAVVIRADGSLQEIRMLRSSGHSILDDAARKIVETAAPFAPFPPTLAAEHRSLEIVRRWRFTNQNQLSTH